MCATMLAGKNKKRSCGLLKVVDDDDGAFAWYRQTDQVHSLSLVFEEGCEEEAKYHTEKWLNVGLESLPSRGGMFSGEKC